MKTCLDHNLRGGKVIEIKSLLDDIQLEYVDSLKESIDVYTTYDEVSSETFADSLICKAKVETGSPVCCSPWIRRVGHARVSKQQQPCSKPILQNTDQQALMRFSKYPFH